MSEKREDVIEIDIGRLLRALWRKIWLVFVVMAIVGGLTLGGTALFVAPKYEASIMMYVNSNANQGDKVSISQTELNTAKSLVETYTVILNTRTTLDEVVARSGVSYTYEEISDMISAESVNSTELMEIVVTSTRPKEATLIANTIAEVLPEKISAIVEGSSTRIVEYAVVPTEPASPNLLKNLVIGMLLGAVIAGAIIVIQELQDDKIHDEDYLKRTYDLPVLAVIPDLMSSPKGSYGYFRANSSEEGSVS